MAISETNAKTTPEPQVLVLQTAVPKRPWFEPVLNLAGLVGGAVGGTYLALKYMVGGGSTAGIDVVTKLTKAEQSAADAAEAAKNLALKTRIERLDLVKERLEAIQFSQAEKMGQLPNVFEALKIPEAKSEGHSTNERATIPKGSAAHITSAPSPANTDVNDAIAKIGAQTKPSPKVSAVSTNAAPNVISAKTAERLLGLGHEDLESVSYFFNKDGTCNVKIHLADGVIQLKNVPKPTHNLHAQFGPYGKWIEVADQTELFMLKQPGGIIHHALGKRAEALLAEMPELSKKQPVWGKLKNMDFGSKINVFSMAMMGIFVGGVAADLLNLGARAMGFTGREAARPNASSENVR
jgi:hypothetical protein